MLIYKLTRPEDTIFVSIMKRKDNNKYSFINLSKEHICSCQFETIKDALQDLNNYIKKGKVLFCEQSSMEEFYENNK